MPDPVTPDCTKIEMSGLPKEGVIRDLRGRSNDWLHNAADDMTDVVLKDWREWKARRD